MNEETTLPIACTLTPEGMAERSDGIGTLLARAEQVEDLPEGYAFRFAGSDELIFELARFIAAERDCCRFFTFELRCEPDLGPVTLTLRGPEGTRDFVSAMLA